jgi:hypothetical protein
VKLPRRAGRPPATALAELHLVPGERLLAWALDQDGQWHVGSDRALHLAEATGYRKLGWEEIERAEWLGDASTLAVVEAADWGQQERRHEITIAEPGELVDLLRERVTRSVLTTAYAKVRRRAGVSVVARRSPVGEGPVLWSYVLAEGLDPDDPEVIDVTQRLRQEAEAELAGL